ncbi:hypothetical protein ACTHGU_20240 [Chitinophagaceae bacterium MMS25-I14]
MNNPKVWLILGATEGLGPAAISYLLANNQLVIPVDTSERLPFSEEMAGFAAHYGPLDFVINNSNYNLFHDCTPDITGCVAMTVDVLRVLAYFLQREPRGSIINMPPQLCLATISDPVHGRLLSEQMDTFLSALRLKLETLDCGLHFLEPGERLPQL